MVLFCATTCKVDPSNRVSLCTLQAGRQGAAGQEAAAEAGAGHAVVPPLDAPVQENNVPNIYGNVTGARFSLHMPSAGIA